MITFWIDGQPPRKSNSRRIVTSGGRTRSIKSQKALDWTQAAILQVPADAKQGLGSADKPIAVCLDIFYTSRRPDLSGELVLDMLQKAGVISDDRHVYVFHLYKGFNKQRPGVFVRVKEITSTLRPRPPVAQD